LFSQVVAYTIDTAVEAWSTRHPRKKNKTQKEKSGFCLNASKKVLPESSHKVEYND
jgi:hypothetical protein